MNFRGLHPNFIIGVGLLPAFYEVNLESAQTWRLPRLSERHLLVLPYSMNAFVSSKIKPAFPKFLGIPKQFAAPWPLLYHLP